MAAALRISLGCRGWRFSARGCRRGARFCRNGGRCWCRGRCFWGCFGRFWKNSFKAHGRGSHGLSRRNAPVPMPPKPMGSEPMGFRSRFRGLGSLEASGLESPNGGAGFFVAEDVSGGCDLVGAIFDRPGAIADCPDASGFAVTGFGKCAGASRFGDAHPFSWVVISEACEDVIVDSVNGDRNDVDVVERQRGCEEIAGDSPRCWR